MKFSHLILSAAVMLSGSATVNAQEFQKYPSGLEYKTITKGSGTYEAQPGDVASLHISFAVSDSTLIDSRKMNNNMPIEQPLNKPNFEGDVFEGILKMKKGEHTEFRLAAKELFARTNQQMPEWIKPGAFAVWHVEMVDVKNKEQMEKEAAEKTAKQMSIDDGLILSHLKSKGITVKALPKNGIVKANPKVAYKDASGLYYIVTKVGTGAAAADDKFVSVNYTGSLLDGKVFDSNVDPKFNHVQPIDFTVGKGQMIKGWDKMLPKMKTGDKVIAILPSALAYGPQARPPHIPANGILQFEMELLSVK
ncbi:MAG: FKBP-type peptidyl-prolyl cis-trans isomerase [Taibaiella sp.]|nr:FKBP-type peptidyl-prolyl cis-trans isomerase [Taibaiella sp.]